MTLKFNGNVNDLLYVNEDETIKMARLVNIDKTMDPETEEILDVCLTSSAPNNEHKLFDSYLGKQITVLIHIDD